jgi:hypothetical protein
MYKDIIIGFQIFMKHGYETIGGAEHDIIWGPPFSINAKLSSDDRIALEDAGWHESSDGDCWAKFV